MPDHPHSPRAIKELIAQFPGVALDPALYFIAKSEDTALLRKLHERAVREGFDCEFSVKTEYTREDALAGDLGMLVPAAANRFLARLPKEAFDLSAACPYCGLGGVRVKPHMMSRSSITCKGPFYMADETACVLMRAEIGYEMAEATGQPDCVRHPVTPRGEVVEEWVEPVPSFTMPPLGSKTCGVTYDEMCPACERSPWWHAIDVPIHLSYPRGAIEKAQGHAVIAMSEPFGRFPDFDPKRRRLKNYFGHQQMLFSLDALRVLAKYIEPAKLFPQASVIIPVFAE